MREVLTLLAEPRVQIVPTQAIRAVLHPQTTGVVGSAGSGKTTFSRWLAEKSPLVGLKEAFGAAPAPGTIYWFHWAPSGPWESRAHLAQSAGEYLAARLGIAQDLRPLGALDAVQAALKTQDAHVVLSYDAPPAIDQVLSVWAALRSRYPRIMVRVWSQGGAAIPEPVAWSWNDDDLFELLASRLGSVLPAHFFERESRPLLGPLVHIHKSKDAARLMGWLFGKDMLAEGDQLARRLMDTLRGKRREITPMVFLKTLKDAAERSLAAGRSSLAVEDLEATLRVTAEQAWTALQQELVAELGAPPQVALTLAEFDWPAPQALLAQRMPEVVRFLEREKILLPVGDRYDLRELYRQGAEVVAQKPVRRFWREYR